MFNVGLGELMAISLLALLIFGPNKLPEIMRSIGKAVRTFQAEGQKARDMLKLGLDEPVIPNAAGVVDRPDASPPTQETRAPVASTAVETEPVAEREYEDT